MSDRYERVYEVGLLDDLHNYFPALLYRPNNFQTVADVLGYVRDRTTQRFNLFDYGRRQYENTVPMQQQNGYQQNTYVPQSSPVEEVRVEFTNSASLLPLLRSLGGLRNRYANTTYEDVIVHASQTIIDRASTELTLSYDLDTICTICQDRMRQGELIRTLNVCHHGFHKSCIDNWLLNRSVICPTCRHDIREPRRSNPSPMLTATATGTVAGTATGTVAGTVTGTAAGTVTGTAAGTTAGTTAGTVPTPIIRQNDLDDMLPGELINILFGRTTGF